MFSSPEKLKLFYRIPSRIKSSIAHGGIKNRSFLAPVFIGQESGGYFS
jgi:hypothetical protein